MAIDFADLALRVNYGDVDKAAQALERLKTASANAETSTNKVGASSVAATRNMGAWAAIQAEATGKLGEHSLAIGRLGYRLESLTSQAVGANSAVGLLGATFLKFGVGDVYSIAILGGIYAVVKAYDLLTESARKATEEQNKAIQFLGDKFRPQTGRGSAVNDAYDDAIKRQALDVQQLRILQASGNDITAAARLRAAGFQAPFLSRGDEIDRLTEDLAKANRSIGLTRAHGAGILPTVDSDDSGVRADREAEAQELEASKRYWEGQSELWKRAREEVAKLNEEVRQYRLNNTPTDIVTTAIKGDIPDHVDIPHVGVGDGLTDLQKRLNDLLKPFDAVGEASYKVAKAMKDAEDGAALFGEAWKPGNILPGARAGAASGVVDALSQFTPQALAFSAASTAINYVVQGVTEMATSFLDGGASARELAREIRLQKDEYQAAAAAFRHDDLAATLANNLATFEGLTKGLVDSMGSVSTILKGGRPAIDAYTGALADLGEQAKRNAALAAQQFEEQQRYAQEDLEVRNLRATGHGDQADLLAEREAQAREYQAAQEKAMADGVITAAEQLYLNTLSTTENSELLAFQNGLLQDALRNAPTGFYGSAAYIGQFATPRGSGALDSGIVRPPVAGGLSTTYHIEAINIDGTKSPKEVVDALIQHLDSVAASTGGSGSSRAQALEVM